MEEEGIIKIENQSPFLLVSFGGISLGFGMPIFEFRKSIKEIDSDKIFIRDFNQMWYQKGVDDKINDLIKLKDYLQAEIAKHKYEKVVFMGNSMGGYASILFGALLEIDEVIAFAPQTFVDKKNRLLNFDFRWRKQMKNVHSNKNRSSEYFDLKPFLNQRPPSKTKINIHYSSKHRLDRVHAERLSETPNVLLHNYQDGGHSVVKELRDNGTLNAILSNCFDSNNK